MHSASQDDDLFLFAARLLIALELLRVNHHEVRFVNSGCDLKIRNIDATETLGQGRAVLEIMLYLLVVFELFH